MATSTKPLPPTAPDTYERELLEHGFERIAGIDEAGRGCIAGPVVAAAVVMRLRRRSRIAHVTDSKLLTPLQREALAAKIRQGAVQWGIGVVSAALIDCTDILRATHVAMRLALDELGGDDSVDFALVDGNSVPDLYATSQAIVGGDRECYSIAAASILAKVYRDRVMGHLDLLYPGYGFARHKGYLTASHREAVMRLGPSPIHRMSFEPLKSLSQGRLEL